MGGGTIIRHGRSQDPAAGGHFSEMVPVLHGIAQECVASVHTEFLCEVFSMGIDSAPAYAEELGDLAGGFVLADQAQDHAFHTRQSNSLGSRCVWPSVVAA